MKINRVYFPANKNTFLIKPIQNLIWKYIWKGNKWIDPFVNNSFFKNKCYKTNDLNPKIKADHHLRAIDFLKSFSNNSINGVLFDPPYSVTQIKECYENIGVKKFIYETRSDFWSRLKDEIKRILKPEGICISFGWNSVGVGKQRGFEIIEILLIVHGGAHYDTIVTVDKKINHGRLPI